MTTHSFSLVPLHTKAKTYTHKFCVTSQDTNNNKSKTWSPNSWILKEKSKYTPTYLNINELKRHTDTIKYNRPPLVFANEIVDLKTRLVDACDGNAFIIQGGECAESIDSYVTNDIIDMIKTLIVMSIIICYVNDKQVIKIARAAGQYAKPRSNPTETIDDVTLPSFFGDNINSIEFTEENRKICPERIVLAHDVAANTMNLIRGMSSSGYLSLYRLHSWILSDTKSLHKDVVNKYSKVLNNISKCIKYMGNCGVDENHNLYTPNIFTSHEALLLEYEESMVRTDSISGQYFDCSAHMVWIGDRTRQLDGQHVEFLRGVQNPIGIKISKNTNLEELVKIIRILNPENAKGKICVICRYGDAYIDEHFVELIYALKVTKLNVVYMIDPMHGNTYKLNNGYKTRDFNKIVSDTRKFFEICYKYSVYPGGVHLEITGNDTSSECVHGLVNNTETDVKTKFKSKCDPRLNLSQCIEYIFHVSSFMK